MEVVFGACALDLERRELRHHGVVQPLEPQAFAVLTYLVTHRDRAIPKAELLEQCWPGAFVTESALTRCIRVIRQAIADDGTHQHVIKTLRGYGYRFVAAVEGPARPAALARPSPPAGPLVGDTGPLPAPPRPVGGPVVPPAPLVEPEAPLGAERRQVTVVSCALSVASAHATPLDPEVLYEVLHAAHETCAAVVTRFAGYRVPHQSEELVVYFGYPQAQEDAAQRAVHTGLGMVAALVALRAHQLAAQGVSLTVRIGIHTGLMVVGTLQAAGDGASLMVGETLTRARQVHAIAPPEAVVVSATTWQRVQGYFLGEELGPSPLPGEAVSCPVYRIHQARGVQTRLDLVPPDRLTPLVGRDAEMALLLDRWAQVKEGRGQVVLLHGEPGIGKSRLIQVLKDHIGNDPLTRWECYSSPYYTNTALYPIIDLLQRTLRLQDRERAEEQLAQLESFVAQYRVSQEETVPLLAQLLTIPLHAAHYPPLTWTPQKQRQKTLETLVAMLLARAEHQPLLFVVEDVHWADPTTVEFLTFLIDQVPTTSLLLFLTTRPDFASPWGSRSYLTPLTLNRLSPQLSGRLVIQTGGGKALPEAVIKQIVQKTDGVPLFIEELTKSVIDSGFIKEIAGHYELTGPLASFAIPVSLQDSLMARLDRLSPVKRIAQIGAVIGRHFSYELLQAVAEVDNATLQHALRQLVEAELLYQRGLSPQATYLFKHALIQETAYQSLLKSLRQDYQGHIAKTLAAHFPETAQTQPELLAHHYTEAALPAIAVRYWWQAGEQARVRSFYREALRHLTKGLEVLATLPDTDERAEDELQLRLAMGASLSAAKGFGSLEVAQEYRRAQEICQRLHDFPRLLPVLQGLRQHFLMRGPIQTAYEVGAQYLELAQRLQDPIEVRQGHFFVGLPLFCLGALSAARTHLEQGHHQGWWAILLWHLGFPDQARYSLQHALLKPLSSALGHAIYIMCGSMLSQLCRDWAETQHRAATLLTLATERELSSPSAHGLVLHGRALAGLGQSMEGMTQIQQGIDACLSTGIRSWHPMNLGMLAAACAQAGQAAAGLRAVREALELIETTQERWWEPELYRLKGELLLQQSPDHHPEAESSFYKALEVAQNQGAKSWELRAATSLAQLWQGQGKSHEALAVLAPLYHWFTEGFDTLDLQEAKALLDDLQGG